MTKYTNVDIIVKKGVLRMSTAGVYVHRLNEEEFYTLLKNRYSENCCSIRAYKYLCDNMNKANGYKRNFSGEDYYVHPQAVAEVLINLVDADDTCVSVALLHDCIEDLDGDVEGVLRGEFGDDITDKILLVTKCKGVDYHIPEKLSEYLMGTLADEDAALVKIADRMNNNSTLTGATDFKKAKKTAETITYFIPLVREAAKKYPHNASFYAIAEEFFGRDID